MDLWDLNTVEVEPSKPVVLHSDEGAARVVAINLPAGEELGDHEVHEHAWLHVHTGSIELEGGQRVGSGGLVHWPPAERHSVRAIDDARLVLMLAPWPGVGHPSRNDAAGGGRATLPA